MQTEYFGYGLGKVFINMQIFVIVKVISDDLLSLKGILTLIAINDQSHFLRMTFGCRLDQLITTYLL